MKKLNSFEKSALQKSFRVRLLNALSWGLSCALFFTIFFSFAVEATTPEAQMKKETIIANFSMVVLFVMATAAFSQRPPDYILNLFSPTNEEKKKYREKRMRELEEMAIAEKEKILDLEENIKKMQDEYSSLKIMEL